MAKPNTESTKDTSKPKETKPVVDAETAGDELRRFGDAFNLDFDKAEMDAEDRAGFDYNCKLFKKGIMQGSIVVDEGGMPSFTPQYSENRRAFEFKEPTGASFLEADKKKKDHDFAKTYAVIGEMTGTSVQIVAALVIRDLKILQAISNLFLG
jgi:hypothetical protein